MFTASSDQDLKEISHWLTQEYETDGAGLYHHLDLITQAHQKGRLVVMHQDSQAAGFHTCGDILERDSLYAVAPAYRGKGLGRAGIEHLVEKARLQDVVALAVLSDSSEFWRKLEFWPLRNGQDRPSRLMYRKLEKSLPLPEGQDVKVVIAFQNESDPEWRHEVCPGARRTFSGQIALDRRVVVIQPEIGELRVLVQVNGEALIECQRVKYLEDYGFHFKDGAFVLEIINPGL